MSKCVLCPRKCNVDREAGERGFCGCGPLPHVVLSMLHRGEEPVLSGTRGAGTIFFGGCNLRCSFCQNASISRGESGRAMDADALAAEMLSLEERGAHNVELVTAGHYLPAVVRALEKVKNKLTVPVVYNSGGYESAEAVRMLEGLVDVFLPDMKYASPELAARLSAAPDYPQVAVAAIDEMMRLAPRVEIEGGLIRRGVIVRHLVLPSFRSDSIEVMRIIAARWSGAMVSIMRQYTPEFNRSGLKALDRRVTEFEYRSVVDEAVRLGLDGFTQRRGCATDEMTPDFGAAER